MSSTDPVADVIDIMLRRDGLVESLSEKPKDKRELVTDLDISRSTVDRGVRELEVLGLIERYEEGYRPTLSGRLLAQEYEAFLHRIESIVSAREILSILPPGCEIDPVVLEGAELISSTDAAPHVPGSHMIDMLSGANRCRGVTRAHSHSKAIETMYEFTVNEGMNSEHVFQIEAFEHLRTTHPEKFHELKESGNFQPFTIDRVPFGLFLIETAVEKRVCVLVYNADNKLMGTITNDSEAALKWGERVYQEYEQRAELVTL